MTYIYIILGILFLIILIITKRKIWDEPHKEIQELKSKLNNTIDNLQKMHNKEIAMLTKRLENSDNIAIQSHEFSDIIAESAWEQIKEIGYQRYLCPNEILDNSLLSSKNAKEGLKKRIAEAIEGEYKYIYLTYLFPELLDMFSGTTLVRNKPKSLEDIDLKKDSLFEVVDLLRRNQSRSKELIFWKNRVAFLEAASSNLTAIPYMAEIMADYETFGIERLARELDWGHSMKRLDKVKSIREIRKDAKEIAERNKEAQYQLAYLINMFPNLSDVIETEYSQLPIISVDELSDYDSVRDYLSKEEYAKLSVVERNQLALDRYKSSHNRSKWQIGRDYELYVGYQYSQKGFTVDYFGSYMGIEDLGRDIIAKKDGKIFIIQCKYWSSKKLIHENHINQLYGTMTCYCIEHNIDKNNVTGVLVTNIELSSMAKRMAEFLGIKYVEKYETGNYPCIKCNIGKDEFGGTTKIYHLPFDQQYDSTKITKNGEFFAMTVAEAEEAGFRRASKWFGA